MARVWYCFTFLLISSGLYAADGLFQAVRSGDKPALLALIRAGASTEQVEETGPEERTPLMVAADQMDPAIADVLIRAGAKVNFQTPRNRMTALMYTASLASTYNDGALTIAKNLLAAGADPDKADIQRNTALMFAVGSGNAPILSVLLMHRARTDLENVRGETPLFLAATNGDRESTKLLLKAGANPNARKKDQVMSPGPIHVAAENGYIEVVEALLEHRADANLKTAGTLGGKTALHIAVEKGNVDLIKVLMRFGANPKIADGAGQTAFDYAKQETEEDLSAELLRVLTTGK